MPQVVGCDVDEAGCPAGRVEDTTTPVAQAQDAALGGGEEQVIGPLPLAQRLYALGQ